MVRFSCFPTYIHYHKSKKFVPQSAEAMEKKIQDSPDLAPKISGSSSSSSPLKLKTNDNNPSNTSAERMTSCSSFEWCLKSEEQNSSSPPADKGEVLQKISFKKSQSLGSGLDKEGRVPCGVDTEDEIDHGLSSDDSHEKSFNRMFDSFDHNRLAESFDGKDPGTDLLNQSQQTVMVESFHITDDLVIKESIFSIGEPQQLEREVQEVFDTHLSTENVGDSGNRTPSRIERIVKSCSLPNLRISSASPRDGLPAHGFMQSRSRSFGDLHALDVRREIPNNKDEVHCDNISQTSHLLGKGLLYHEASGEDCVVSNPSGGSYEVADQERDHIFESGKHIYENHFSDGYDSFNFPGLAKDWRVSEIEEVDEGNNNIQQESSVQRWDELPCKDFNIKRIEDWVSSIDLQTSYPLQELGECSNSTPKMKDSVTISDATAAKFDHRITPGMEVANNYISSLSAASASAQMANIGLVVIPFLSAFSSLRVLNLSGNNIVRITAGALPRGLHMLNLSKNNISTIEGLRELTRLRVLDLSYNRIFRIGHGLASCSSLKELYLAGNKISEVEGLHRLLKLNVLDLRFNKISTAKCLGQLAANYSSLQSINLEGNPAQRNVGDDQLKKYLLSVLPHLVYFNRHTIKSSASKEVADRPARSSTAYQFDRGLRSEHKLSWRGNHGSSAHKPASSSSHGRLSQAVAGLPKRSRGHHGRRPPTVSRGTQHQLNIGSKLVNFASSHSMRRSRSEGTL
ncbi:uncharacterized protein LOC131237185 [Magnolia sinica]|uniref:uncharacterized protein LOC131237185 n=1 Tax=Magnolia sinica TaxID=86752 RepID=UPI00265966C2|nr:uncharacterized protein LOC131237185 [Magnolia sinica]XP_058090848.1 uncharacterized protein LOC131237185 [Magnolia sinica]